MIDSTGVTQQANKLDEQDDQGLASFTSYQYEKKLGDQKTPWVLATELNYEFVQLIVLNMIIEKIDVNKQCKSSRFVDNNIRISLISGHWTDGGD